MYNRRKKIIEILNSSELNYETTVMGWVRTFRNNQFITLNDGSTILTLQVVLDFTKFSEEILKKITTGACIKVKGKVTPSLGKGQKLEIQAQEIELLGSSDPEKFPLQPKKHSLEFLREIANLRFRTTTFQSVFKIRNSVSFAIHQFFNQKGFVYLHSPILTAADCEGAGELFTVTQFDLNQLPKNEQNQVDYSQDFFGKHAHLTVSGQLQGELAAMGLGEIYTFGPTFRAENSNTTRHLAEFWMIEPEMAFCDIEDNMNLAEEMLKYLIEYILKHHEEDLAFLNKRFIEENANKPQHERAQSNLLEKMEFCLKNPFERITYSEGIDILKNSKDFKKGKFKFPVEWGIDLQSEHERYLVEKHFLKPVILTDYPKDIKAFYMKQNEDGKTVRAMDVLFPGIGEIIGGSQREENYDKLVQRMKEMKLPIDEMEWYLDTRKFGTCVHSGFGLGLERFLLFVTGMANVRDVIPFPRTPQSINF